MYKYTFEAIYVNKRVSFVSQRGGGRETNKMKIRNGPTDQTEISVFREEKNVYNRYIKGGYDLIH